MRWIRERLPGIDIMVDGGINASTSIDAVAAGANQLVSGSYLYGKADMAAEVAALRARLEASVANSGTTYSAPEQSKASEPQ